MKHTMTLACLMASSVLLGQCTVTDLDFNGVNVRWADGYSDAQGHIWGAAYSVDGSGDVFAVHLDDAGAVVWNKRFATLNPYIGLYPTAVVATATGGMLIVGNRVTPTYENWFGIQVDANGDLEWARIYMEPTNAGDGFGSMPKVTAVPGGGYQITLPANPGIHTTRLASDGTPIWHKKYTVSLPVEGYDLTDVAVAADGGLLFSVVLFNTAVEDTTATLVMKTDDQGTPLWASKITGAEFDGRTLLPSDNGDLILGGRNGWWSSSVPYEQTTLARVDANGSLLWMKRYSTIGQIESIAELANGDLFLSTLLTVGWNPTTTAHMVHTTSDGTPDQSYSSTFFGNMNFSDHYYFPRYGVQIIPENSGGVTGLENVFENNAHSIRRVRTTNGTDLSCGFDLETVTEEVVSGVTSDPISVTPVDENVRTWTMALVGYDQTLTELQVHMHASIPPRPGFTYYLSGSIWNYGGNTSGPTTVSLTYASPASFVSADPPPTSVTSDSVIWEIPAGLAGFTPQYFNCTFSLPPDVSLIGQQLTHSFSAAQDSAEFTLTNNTATLVQTIVGSYDPNDKLVYPQDYFHITNDSVLDYTIRFQNTGTFMAETVVLRDTLPADVDVLSFRVGAASHPFTYTLSGNGILEVRFDNIDLPDSSSNEPLSHGMFGFRIKPIQPLQLGQEITNRADIFFDFNPPIRTPDATVVVTSETGIRPLVKPLQLVVFPTPATDRLQVQLPDGFAPRSGFITGADGRKLPMSPGNIRGDRMEIPVAHLRTGLHVLTLFGSNGQRLTARFVKE